MRCVAGSNRRTRFCRPLTKPLIQRTRFECGCKSKTFFACCQIFSLFFFLIGGQCAFTRWFHAFLHAFSQVFKSTARTTVAWVGNLAEGFPDTVSHVGDRHDYDEDDDDML